MTFLPHSSSESTPATFSKSQMTKGERRTPHCRRRSDSRPSKDPEGAQVRGTHEVHPRILRELADEVAKPLSLHLRSCGSPVKFPVIVKRET